MRSNLLCLLLWAALLVALPAQADIYKYRDRNGNLVFSDTLPADANNAKVEKIDIKPAMIVPAFKMPDSLTAHANPSAKAQSKTPDYEVMIQSPLADAYFQRNSGEDIPVSISVSPTLQEGHRLVVFLDGYEISGAPALPTADLERGSHQIQARVVDASGKALATSGVTFYIQQHSMLGPIAPK